MMATASRTGRPSARSPEIETAAWAAFGRIPLVHSRHAVSASCATRARGAAGGPVPSSHLRGVRVSTQHPPASPAITTSTVVPTAAGTSVKARGSAWTKVASTGARKAGCFNPGIPTASRSCWWWVHRSVYWRATSSQFHPGHEASGELHQVLGVGQRRAGSGDDRMEPRPVAGGDLVALTGRQDAPGGQQRGQPGQAGRHGEVS
jgi:hypothetical protein